MLMTNESLIFSNYRCLFLIKNGIPKKNNHTKNADISTKCQNLTHNTELIPESEH